METKLVRVAASADVGGPPFLRVRAGAHRLLLARTADGAVHAFEAACPHLGQPLRRAGLSGSTLECPHHHYAYDLDTGCNVEPGGPADPSLRIFEVIEQDGAVYVRVPVRQGTSLRP